jgi:pimeloyl-ACP methyl ester carboxylesterase
MHTETARRSDRTPKETSATPPWLDRTAYPFESRFLEVLPGTKMHYVDEGAGDTMLFVHGTPTWSFEWRHAIRDLSHNHRCIAMDHLGFGLSDRPRDFDYKPESHSRVLRTFVDRLGLDSITLVVHDYGGPIAFPLYLDTPDLVRRLVIINSWMWSFEDDREMTRKAKIAGGAFGRFLYRYANFSLRVLTPSAYADRAKLTREIHAQYLAPFPDAGSRGRVLWPLAHAILGSSAYYDSLWKRRDVLAKRPVLIAWGTKDPAFPPYMLDRWRGALPHARVVELPVGHWPQEEAPAELTQAIQRFLDG